MKVNPDSQKSIFIAADTMKNIVRSAQMEATDQPYPDLLGIETRWPELFTPLDETHRELLNDAFASIWHEGWIPNREDVKDLSEHLQGIIDITEYNRRSRVAAERYTGTLAS
jgi:hypothetical protein